MTRQAQPFTESRPSDFVGKSSDGKIRIDRVIPLPWVLGIIGAGVVNAASMYYGLQQVIGTMVDLKTEVRVLTTGMAAANNRDTEHALRIQSLERRVDLLESKKP